MVDPGEPASPRGPAPEPHRLVDAYGREVTDLRVSLTKRCNFACVYCHNEGLGDTLGPAAPAPDEMTPEEVLRILRVAHGFGVTRVKFTGGEPTLRADLPDIVRGASRLMETSLTTNGSLLERQAPELARAGLSRVNVSLDSLDPHHFRRTRRGSLDPVLRGIAAALAAGLTPVKVNAVVLDDTLPEMEGLVDWVAATPGLQLQLIEVMPEIRTDMAPRRVEVGSVKRWLAQRADRVEVRDMHHRRIYHVGRAAIEFVDPVENPEFCANCRRLRVTHDGQLKGCLNRLDDYVPTRGLDEEALRDAFRRVVAQRVPYYGVYDRAQGRGREDGPLPARGAEALYASLRRPRPAP